MGEWPGHAGTGNGPPAPRRTLEQLLNVDDPGWPLVEGWIETSNRSVDVLPPAATCGDALLATQATVRSALGAVVYETGGVLLDHGWLRVLGSGHPRLPRTLPGWNRAVHGEADPLPFRLVADDAVGGFYAINQGGLGQEGRGNVFFFAPDRMVWEDMGAGYTDWLQWALHGDLKGYYRGLRWPGWENEVVGLAGDQALSLAPPPFLKEGRDVAKASKRAVPVLELYGLYVNEFAPQLAGAQHGDAIELKVTPSEPTQQ